MIPASYTNNGTDADYLQRETGLPPITNFTIMAWFNVTSFSAWKSLIGIGDAVSGADDHYRLTFDSGAHSLSFWNSATGASGTIELVAGIWAHIAMTVAGIGANQAKVYIDAVEDISMSGSTAPSASQIYLLEDGNTLNGGAPDANTTNLKIWNRALSPMEIAEERANFEPVNLRALNSWYPLNRISGIRDWSGLGKDDLTNVDCVLDHALGPRYSPPKKDAPHYYQVPAAVVTKKIMVPDWIAQYGIPTAGRRNADSDLMHRTTALPSTISYTITGWYRRKEHQVDWDTVVAMTLSATTNEHLLLYAYDSSLGASINNNGDSAFTPSILGGIPVGEWWFFALMGSNTGAGGGKARLSPGLGLWHTAETDGGDYAASDMGFGRNGIWTSEATRGDHANIKIWNVPLTDEELKVERASFEPISRPGKLYGWYPMLDGNIGKNILGGGKDLTVTSIVIISAPDIVLEQAEAARPHYYGAAAGGPAAAGALQRFRTMDYAIPGFQVHGR